MKRGFKLPLVGLGTCYYEFYFAQQLVDGSSYKEIAVKLGVSSGRVNDLVRQIYGKLGVHGKDELAKLV